VASRRRDGVGRDSRPVARALALGSADLGGAVPTRGGQRTTPFRRVRETRPARRPAGVSGRLGRAGWWGRTGPPAPCRAPGTPSWCGRRSSRGGCPPADWAARTRRRRRRDAGSRASCRGAPGACGRSRPRPQLRTAARDGQRWRSCSCLLAILILLAFGQHLRGRHPRTSTSRAWVIQAVLTRSVLSTTCSLASSWASRRADRSRRLRQSASSPDSSAARPRRHHRPTRPRRCSWVPSWASRRTRWA
jgi:hypothetical protein